jgi:hypothetical protein
VKEKEIKPFIEVNPKEVDQQGYIRLPLNESGFKDFISGLLGTPQSISRTILGSFDCNPRLLINLKSLLDQRIGIQNGTALVKFNAVLNFFDRSKVEINSFEELISYNDVGTSPTERLSVEFIYLVQFNEKSPEKQSIKINFYSSKEDRLSEKRDFFIEDEDRVIFDSSSGRVYYKIEHTNRAFGFDLKSILDNFFENNMSKVSNLEKFLYNNFSGLWTISCIIFAVSLGYFISNTLPFKIDQKLFDQYELIKGSDIISLHKKIDYISRNGSGYLSKSFQSLYYLMFPMISMLIFMVTRLIGSIFEIKSQLFKQNLSFIAFNQSYDKNKNDTLSQSKVKFSIVRIVVSSIFLAVVGNAAYDLLKNAYFSK